jgi:translation initiation factor 3 subunit I
VLTQLQVLLVGGQEASEVTVTADAAGGFETHFFHKVYEEEFGQVRGHFGPVNSVAISPDGKSFATGGEDGFVRLQHFDMDYLATNFVVEA